MELLTKDRLISTATRERFEEARRARQAAQEHKQACESDEQRLRIALAPPPGPIYSSVRRTRKKRDNGCAPTGLA